MPTELLEKPRIPSISGALAPRKDNYNTDPQSYGIVGQIVEGVGTTFGASYNGLVHAVLYHLMDIPPSIQLVWMLSTASVPALLPSSQCWAKYPPSMRELVTETLELIARHPPPSTESEYAFWVNYQGEVDRLVDPATTIA
jgi:hypothetical protein